MKKYTIHILFIVVTSPGVLRSLSKKSIYTGHGFGTKVILLAKFTCYVSPEAPSSSSPSPPSAAQAWSRSPASIYPDLKEL